MMAFSFSVYFFLYCVIHMIVVFLSWINRRFLPGIVRIGLMDRNMGYLYRTALKYAAAGMHVPEALLIPPEILPLSCVRKLERRLLIEFFLAISVATLPSALFLLLS